MEKHFSSLWDRTSAGIIIYLSLGLDRAISISKTCISNPNIILVFLYFLLFVWFGVIVLYVLMSHFIAMTRSSSPSGLDYLKPTTQNGSNFIRRSGTLSAHPDRSIGGHSAPSGLRIKLSPCKNIKDFSKMTRCLAPVFHLLSGSCMPESETYLGM